MSDAEMLDRIRRLIEGRGNAEPVLVGELRTILAGLPLEPIVPGDPDYRPRGDR